MFYITQQFYWKDVRAILDKQQRRKDASLLLHHALWVFPLQKRIRKDPESVKPQAAATIIGGKRAPVAASRAPVCKLPIQPSVFASLFQFTPKS